ncbi:MAG: tRNA 2-thiocytidine(32) synthetase TtcA [Desulfovibrio sp.]|nr:tRNA 2-thiocytidine(32) synthetase TtcA [Desulfovibrio sp.]
MAPASAEKSGSVSRRPIPDAPSLSHRALMSRGVAYVQRQAISLCGKAVHGWAMIEDGDSVAVALSGGKDSLSLLWLLAERKRRVPISFHIKAIHVEMGYHTVSHDDLRRFCDGLEVPLTIIDSDYGPRAHSPENRENSPCFFCALNRRRELFIMADQLGCRKLALAHHQDDTFETFLLNLLYAGNLSTMLPVQPFFGGKLVVIRPLALMSADLTRRFSAHLNLPVQPPCCPSSSLGHRAMLRDFLEGLHKNNRRVRSAFWHAISSSGLPMLPIPPTTQRQSRSRKKTPRP